LASAFDHFAVELAHDRFEGLFRTFETERQAIKHYIARCGEPLDAAADVWRTCGFARPSSEAAVRAEALSGCDWSAWRSAAMALAQGGLQDQAMAALLLAAADCAQDHPERFDRCWNAFAKADGEAKADRSLCTQGAPDSVRNWLRAEQARFQEAVGRARSARVASDTVHALNLAYAYGEFYEGEKAARGALDFPDLIERTRNLLTRRASAAWVLYKLDGGIDHVLLDEAQDTAPEQWDILEALTGDFFTGAGLPSDRPLARTVFAVGDEKQSIYSFQGARPEQLRAQTAAYQSRAGGAGRPFVEPALVESWRGTPEVLRFVDAVFADPALRAAVPAPRGQAGLQHLARRPPGAGAVDLWPLEADVQIDPPDAWDPVDADPPESARKRLARRVAAEAARIVREDAVRDKGERLRPARPGDVLILVRKRDAVFEEVIRALKQAAVPVAGADKLALSDHIVFEDVLAMIRVCLFPSDDLRLAAILRSPFCSIDEQGLFDLAYGREGSLWAALGARAGERPEWGDALAFLMWAQEQARTRTPFSFLGRVLSYLDRQGRSVRQRILTRLGHEAEDALDELLAEALKAEARGLYDLERFAAALERSEIQVKRELEAGGGEVRVMTVHGAKGLEAPIVILPEAAGAPPKPVGPLLRTRNGGFLFAPRKADDGAASAEARAFEAERQAEESLRLLYVALTRARDRVIIAGRLPGNAKDGAPDPGSWYARITAAFDRPEIADQSRMIGEVRRFGADPPPAPAARGALKLPPLPDWARRAPPHEPLSARYAAPSLLAEVERGPSPSPLARSRGLGRFRRGELIHKLLEVLPDLPAAARADGARRLLAKVADLDQEQRAEMAAAALTVLEDDRFAEVFGPGSVAEAAIAGGAPDLPSDLMISGRIDRMTITSDRVLVVDFKTNRPAPEQIEQADRAYVVQMAVYVAVLRALYPGRSVEAALVWTDGPKLMAVPDNLIDRTLAGLRAGR
jgi:ATP-dependent helicase/nuclease subunit A